MVGSTIVCVWALDSTESRGGELSTKCTGVHRTLLVDCIESRGGELSELSIGHKCVHCSPLAMLNSCHHDVPSKADCDLELSQRDPASPKLLLVRVFYQSNRNENRSLPLAFPAATNGDHQSHLCHNSRVLSLNL